MPSSNIHNFHLPLSTEIYQQIKSEAKKSKQTVTELMRQAIHSWLIQRKKMSLHKEISQYASQYAGTSFDSDPDLEAAAAENLFTLGND